MRAVVTAFAVLQTAAFQTPRLRRPPASTHMRRPPTQLRGAPIGPHEVEAAVDAAVKAALATAKSSTFWEVTTAFIAEHDVTSRRRGPRLVLLRRFFLNRLLLFRKARRRLALRLHLEQALVVVGPRTSIFSHLSSQLRDAPRQSAPAI